MYNDVHACHVHVFEHYTHATYIVMLVHLSTYSLFIVVFYIVQKWKFRHIVLWQYAHKQVSMVIV